MLPLLVLKELILNRAYDPLEQLASCSLSLNGWLIAQELIVLYLLGIGYRLTSKYLPLPDDTREAVVEHLL